MDLFRVSLHLVWWVLVLLHQEKHTPLFLGLVIPTHPISSKGDDNDGLLGL
jgi:hypothetical protein